MVAAKIYFSAKDIQREKTCSNKSVALMRSNQRNISSTLYKGFWNWYNFQKIKYLLGKNPFFVIGPFCTPHSNCLSIGFWWGSFVSKYYVFNLSTFNWKTLLQLFENDFQFWQNLIQSIGEVQIFLWLSHKNMPISPKDNHIENNFKYSFLEDPMLFLLILK